MSDTSNGQNGHDASGATPAPFDMTTDHALAELVAASNATIRALTFALERLDAATAPYNDEDDDEDGAKLADALEILVEDLRMPIEGASAEDKIEDLTATAARLIDRARGIAGEGADAVRLATAANLCRVVAGEME